MDDLGGAISGFLAEVADIPWLESAGAPHDGLRAVSLSNACHGYWPDTDAVWLAQTTALELAALDVLSDGELSWIFETVGREVGPRVRRALDNVVGRGFDRADLESAAAIDAYGRIASDVSWAAVEAALRMGGFFTELLSGYRRGRWPCNWSGAFPDGGLVVF